MCVHKWQTNKLLIHIPGCELPWIAMAVENLWGQSSSRCQQLQGNYSLSANLLAPRQTPTPSSSILVYLLFWWCHRTVTSHPLMQDQLGAPERTEQNAKFSWTVCTVILATLKNSVLNYLQEIQYPYFTDIEVAFWCRSIIAQCHTKLTCAIFLEVDFLWRTNTSLKLLPNHVRYKWTQILSNCSAELLTTEEFTITLKPYW